MYSSFSPVNLGTIKSKGILLFLFFILLKSIVVDQRISPAATGPLNIVTFKALSELM